MRQYRAAVRTLRQQPHLTRCPVWFRTSSLSSYLGTARNHGIHPLDALRDALAGNPWMPPETS